MEGTSKKEQLQEWMKRNGKKWMIRSTALFIVILIIVKLCFMIDCSQTLSFL